MAVTRTFLTAFATDPANTKKLAAEDALFVYIHMGGPYREMVKGLSGKKSLLAGCKLDSIRQTATPPIGPPPAEVREGFPTTAFDTPGRFANVEAVYSCKRPDGGTALLDVNVWLKNDLMVMFGLAPRRGTLMPPK